MPVASSLKKQKFAHIVIVHSNVFRINSDHWPTEHTNLASGAFAKLRKETISFVTPVCPSAYPSAWKNSAPTIRIFIKFDIWGVFFFENLSRKFKFDSNLTWITSTLHGHLCTFVIISRWNLCRMRNISDKRCRENQHISRSITFFFFKNRAVYEITW